MPKVHYVKKARKDYPDHGIKKGEAYYHWSFYRGAKHYSKTKPSQSQLTGSPFLSELYSLQEEIAAASPTDLTELQELRDDWVSRARDLADQAQESFDNMPEGLQQGDTGQLLEERANVTNDWAADLENVDLEPDPGNADRLTEALEELQNCEVGL